jgi:PAS domain S-box-containing protein
MEMSSQELQDFYESAPCGFHSLNSDAEFIDINQTELRWLGYSGDEIVSGMKLTDILTVESRHIFEQNFKRLKSGGSVRDLELNFLRKDGTVLAVLVCEAAVDDPQGRFLLSRSVVYNLTDRLRSNVSLRAILDAASDPMVISSRSGEILLTNSQADKLFGYDIGEMRGRPVETLMAEHLRADHVKHQHRFFALAQTRPMGSGFELRGLKNDGTEFPIEVGLSPLEFNGVLAAVAVIRDLTELRAFEEKARHGLAKYQLLFENSMDGIVLTTPDGAILEANPSACRILGRTRESLLDACREDILDTSDPAVAQFLEKQESRSKAAGQLRGRRGDGTLFQLDITSVVFEESNNRACYCLIFRDIAVQNRPIAFSA